MSTGLKRWRCLFSLPVVASAMSVVMSTGCAGHADRAVDAAGSPEFRFATDAYPGVFEAAMETLAELRFVPDRIDAARGVITTYPKQTAGLASPWDREQSSIHDEGRDLLHQHERVCRIVFDPPDAPTTALVEVTILRVRRPGWRVETDAIGLSTHTINPVARREGDEPEFRDPIGSDAALADRISAMIEERVRPVSAN